ncbi:MAG TPA: bifunctional diguanylate cyclase/phosphodiesterase, partial [Stellaceae bacterium]|nr:bifunctional diguanylate cyclase/phosphodiesterase [Stellaceae bacterium]
RYLAASPEWIAAFGIFRFPLAGNRHAELSAAGLALDQVTQRALAGETIESDRIGGDDAAQPAVAGTVGARPYRDPNGMVAGVIVTLHLSGQDPTELLGRREFVHLLRDALAALDRQSRAIVVVALDLDGLRSVNNLHGVAVGDQVVQIIARRLVSGTRSRSDAAAAARPRDGVCRLGPGQFGVVGEAGAPDGAEALARRLLRIVAGPIAIGPLSLRVNASAGLVVPTGAHRDADDVLRDLDLALQQAAALGPNKVIAWEPSLTEAATRRYSLAERLRRAFDDGELLLHYQPVLRLSDSRMVGAEALLRWNHPSDGLVAAAAFVPALEASGLIVEVGCWAIREAVRQVESWRMLYGRDIIDWVSVNLSGRQFNDPEPLLTTVRTIHDGGFSIHRLKVELSETVFMHNPEIARAVLTELQALGVGAAIDDFGTAYSSLNTRRHYPVDTIKIDGEFVAQVGTAEGEKLTQALLDVARTFGAVTVAEGIETETQRDFLRRSGCELGQGYLFGEPMGGALLGAYALTHAVNGGHRPRSSRAPAETISPPTSAGPLRAR